MSSMSKHKIQLTIATVALFGMVIIFLSTPHGLGLSPDSLGYFRGGRAILADGLFAEISQHWPPGYPALLAMFSAMNGDMFLAARLIGIAAFGANLFLFAQLMRRTGWSRPLEYFSILILVCDPAFLFMHLMAWSEPVFLVFLQLGLLALLQDEDGKKNKYATLAGLVFGLAIFVRYAGLATVAGIGSVFILQLFQPKKEGAFSERLKRFISFSIMAAAPILLWMAIRSNVPNENNIRKVVYHSIDQQKWYEGLHTISNWFGGSWLSITLLAIVVTLLIRGARTLQPQAKQLLTYSGAIVFAYILFITTSLTFFDAYIPLDNRILIPLKILAYTIIFISFQTLTEKWRVVVTGIFTTLILLMNYPSARSDMKQSSLEGIGFAQVGLKDMPVLQFIRENKITPDATNAPELTSLFLNQETALLPRTFDPTTTIANPELNNQMKTLMQPRKTIVIFNNMAWRAYLYTPNELYNQGFKKIMYQGPDGIILQYQ